MAILKLKKLEEYLQMIDDFVKPKILFEQYSTPSHIASCMLYEIQTKFDDIEDKLIGDLGAGCGMLSIGASLLGARLCIGFEIDADAIKVSLNLRGNIIIYIMCTTNNLQIFKNNTQEMEINDIDCIQCNLNDDAVCSRWYNVFDTIIMNPPFGTKKNAGQDMRFLEVALKLTNNVVYSLHKSSTRYILKK